MVDKVYDANGNLLEIGDTVVRWSNNGPYLKANEKDVIISFSPSEISSAVFVNTAKYQQADMGNLPWFLQLVRKGNKVSKFNSIIEEVPVKTTRKIKVGKFSTKDYGAIVSVLGVATNTVRLFVGNEYGENTTFSARDLRELAELATELADVLEGK